MILNNGPFDVSSARTVRYQLVPEFALTLTRQLIPIDLLTSLFHPQTIRRYSNWDFS